MHNNLHVHVGNMAAPESTLNGKETKTRQDWHDRALFIMHWSWVVAQHTGTDMHAHVHTVHVWVYMYMCKYMYVVSLGTCRIKYALCHIITLHRGLSPP